MYQNGNSSIFVLIPKVDRLESGRLGRMVEKRVNEKEIDRSAWNSVGFEVFFFVFF